MGAALAGAFGRTKGMADYGPSLPSIPTSVVAGTNETPSWYV